MDTCFLCQHMLVPSTPTACKCTALQRAFEAIQFACAKNIPVRVADYRIRLFERPKVCLIQEFYDPKQPKISLTNSIETAIVQICSKYGLCPARWTFVEYANGGNSNGSYHEYDMVVLGGDNIEWKYLWHSDCRRETQPYSDSTLR